MPKIIKSGIFSPEYNIPKTPPAKLVTTCRFCTAVIETEEVEEKVKLGKKRSNDGTLFVGWILKCPECRRNIFFPHLDISNKDLGKINGHGK